MPDDAPMLQTLIDVAADAGATELRLTAGTYTLRTQLNLRSNLAIIGAPNRGTILQLAADVADKRMLMGSGLVNVTVRGLVLDSNDRPAASFAAGEGTCIYLTGCTGVLVEDNELKGGYWYGAWTHGCSEVTIELNEVHHCGSRGIWVTAGENAPSNDIRIERNNVHHIDRDDTRVGSGIGAQGHLLEHRPLAGLHKVTKLRIRKNKCRYNGRNGILIAGAQNWRVYENWCTDNKGEDTEITRQGAGIQITEGAHDGRIYRNRCTRNRGGIDIDTITRNLDGSDSYVWGDIDVYDNKCWGNVSAGIHVNHAPRVEIYRNGCWLNDYGVLINGKGADNCTVRENVLDSNRTNGIAATIEAPNQLRALTLTENELSLNGTAGAGAEHRTGIRLHRVAGFTDDGTNRFHENVVNDWYISN